MHWLNGDGTVLWANQTELNVLGYTAEEYIGQPIMQFCPDEEELVLEIFKQLGTGNVIKVYCILAFSDQNKFPNK